MSHNRPPVKVPSSSLAMTDPRTGIVTPPWYRVFVDLLQVATPLEKLDWPGAPPASPLTLRTNHPGYWFIRGAVTRVDLTRGQERPVTITDVVPTTLTKNWVPVAAQDAIVITFAVLPEIWFVASGVPA